MKFAFVFTCIIVCVSSSSINLKRWNGTTWNTLGLCTIKGTCLYGIISINTHVDLLFSLYDTVTPDKLYVHFTTARTSDTVDFYARNNDVASSTVHDYSIVNVELPNNALTYIGACEGDTYMQIVNENSFFNSQLYVTFYTDSIECNNNSSGIIYQYSGIMIIIILALIYSL